jgi:phage terminase large subunit-like protein
MRSRERTNLFTIAAQRFVTEVQDRRFTHDGSRSMRAHVLNARRRPNEWGVSLGKEHRESKRKIDMAVCAVGARMVRRLLLNKTTTTTKPRSGKVWHS